MARCVGADQTAAVSSPQMTEVGASSTGAPLPSATTIKDTASTSVPSIAPLSEDTLLAFSPNHWSNADHEGLCDPVMDGVRWLAGGACSATWF